MREELERREPFLRHRERERDRERGGEVRFREVVKFVEKGWQFLVGLKTFKRKIREDITWKWDN